MNINDQVNQKAGTVGVNYMLNEIVEVLLGIETIKVNRRSGVGLDGNPYTTWVATKNNIEYKSTDYAESICLAYIEKSK